MKALKQFARQMAQVIWSEPPIVHFTGCLLMVLLALASPYLIHLLALLVRPALAAAAIAYLFVGRARFVANYRDAA